MSKFEEFIVTLVKILVGYYIIMIFISCVESIINSVMIVILTIMEFIANTFGIIEKWLNNMKKGIKSFVSKFKRKRKAGK